MNIFTGKLESISKENVLSGHNQRENNWWPLLHFLSHFLFSKSEYTQKINLLKNIVSFHKGQRDPKALWNGTQAPLTGYTSDPSWQRTPEPFQCCTRINTHPSSDCTGQKIDAPSWGFLLTFFFPESKFHSNVSDCLNLHFLDVG